MDLLRKMITEESDDEVSLIEEAMSPRSKSGAISISRVTSYRISDQRRHAHREIMITTHHA